MPALLAVAAAGPLSVSELARRLGLGLSTTSAIVGQLSRAGLLERAEDDADRRRTIVRLHEDYSTALGAWLKQALAPLRGTLERLHASRTRPLHGGLADPPRGSHDTRRPTARPRRRLRGLTCSGRRGSGSATR